MADSKDKRAEKISITFKRKKLNNFAKWQDEQRKLRSDLYTKLVRNGDLAELLGAVLGDGYIGQHERTQVLRIASNSNAYGFIERYSKLVEQVFGRKPRVSKRKTSNCTDIVIYQNNISELLGLMTGAKTHRPFILPGWIKRSKEYKLRFLRGLYETDGCLAHHSATYTHKFIFSNINQSLLETVFMLLFELGFHPTKTKTNVQLSRKVEVEQASKMVKFRLYN